MWNAMPDIEMGHRTAPIESRIHGYPAAADFIARDSDHECFIFRKFGNLAARRLLYLQSELIELEAQQRKFDDEIQNSDGELQYSMQKWENFSGNAKCRDAERLRMQLANEIDEKLNKYYKALALQRHVFQFEKPTKNAIEAFRIEILGERPKILGNARQMLSDGEDLVALNPVIEKDALSLLLRNNWPFPTKILSGDSHGRISYFRKQSLSILVSVCSIAIAAILLIGSILALYFVTDPDARLSLVILFIVLFALGLSMTTGCSRDSLFAATAAYAAVLVVFVSGNLGRAQTGERRQ